MTTVPSLKVARIRDWILPSRVTVEQGARRIYSVSSTGLEVLRDYIESFRTDVLGAFADTPNQG